MVNYDPLTKSERSERMSRVRGIDTKPEMLVRRLVHRLGYRYRLHVQGLPGRPDMVFRPRRKVIFVHGCFWHQHGCRQYRMPKSRKSFWVPKLRTNVERDLAVQTDLRNSGWDVLVIWECELREKNALEERVVQFLDGEE